MLVLDRYEWDCNEYLIVPNPDFCGKMPKVVRSKDSSVQQGHEEMDFETRRPVDQQDLRMRGRLGRDVLKVALPTKTF